jgi:hypothetical protein
MRLLGKYPLASVIMAASISVAAGTAASAQMLPGMSCADFEPLTNGMWRPTHPITIRGPNGQASMDPGASFGTGASFMGVNLAAMLDANCPH